MTVKSGDMLDSSAGAEGRGERVDRDRRDLAAAPGGTVLAQLCDPLPDRRAGWSLAAPVGPARQQIRGFFPAIQGGTGHIDRTGRVCRCQAITNGLTPAMDKILAHPDSGIAR